MQDDAVAIWGALACLWLGAFSYCVLICRRSYSRSRSRSPYRSVSR